MSVFTCGPCIKISSTSWSKEIWWCGFCLISHLNLNLENIFRLCIMRSSANSFIFWLRKSKSGYSRGSHMDQKCMKFPAVLFSKLLPPTFTPELSQTLTACPLLVSHNCCLQLISKWGRDSATQLRGNCHSHASLAPAFLVDEEKCIHSWDVAATDI